MSNKQHIKEFEECVMIKSASYLYVKDCPTVREHIYCITNTKIIYINLYILYIYLNFHMKIYVARNKIIIIFISRDFKAAFANNIQKMEILGK